MKIETLKTEKLVPYARNAKKHDAGQVAKIAGSIREFGFCNPVLVDKDNGIIAGHGRVLAAQSLGLADVPCIRLGHLSDTQRRAYILADNRLSEIGGGWDDEMLKIEITELKSIDLTSLTFSGWTDEELENIITPGDFVENPEQEWEDMPEYKNQPKGVRTIIVHFPSEAAVIAFGKCIGQLLPDSAKFIWYPSRPKGNEKDSQFIGQPE